MAFGPHLAAKGRRLVFTVTPAMLSGPEPMRIAIIGAGGVVGTHVIEHLLAEGRYEVLGIDVSGVGPGGSSNSGVTFFQADVQSALDVVERVIRSATLVVDLVAYGNLGMYVTDPLDVFDLHFLQSLEIAKLCIRHRKRLIHYSSAEVYGKGAQGSVYSEDLSDSAFGPAQDQRWLGPAAKMLLERVLYAHGMAGNLEFTTVRPFDLVGMRLGSPTPGSAFGAQRLVQAFTTALRASAPLRVVDGGHARRNPLYIEDANRALQVILDHPQETRNRIYNVGNPGNELSVGEIAVLMMDLYEELTGRRPSSEVVYVTGQDASGRQYEEPRRLSPDISKLRALGWAPRHDARAALRQSMATCLDEMAQSQSNALNLPRAGIDDPIREFEPPGGPHAAAAGANGRRVGEPAS
jgi:UDP-apiose/xylose synthase